MAKAIPHRNAFQRTPLSAFTARYRDPVDVIGCWEKKKSEKWLV
jgi:hypothetical protein